MFHWLVERHQDAVFLDRQPEQIGVSNLLMTEDSFPDRCNQIRPAYGDWPETKSRPSLKIRQNRCSRFYGICTIAWIRRYAKMRGGIGESDSRDSGSISPGARMRCGITRPAGELTVTGFDDWDTSKALGSADNWPAQHADASARWEPQQAWESTFMQQCRLGMAAVSRSKIAKSWIKQRRMSGL
jgi:hypothetical protein